MSYKILVTGGAGFIGSFLVDKLIEEGHDVRILDNLEPQVHTNGKPSYLNPKADFIYGSILDSRILEKALEDIEIVFHEAAMVGVGQSMYQISKYCEVNMQGTANLWDKIINKENSVKKVIVASSMSTYGEGSYICRNCGEVEVELRSVEQMQKKEWEVYCPHCKEIVKPVPTKESKTQKVNSIYALTKKAQEEMTLNIGRTYGLPSVALRYFNVFGPRQSLSNPYTGIIAIFTANIKNSNSPLIFEDGLQSRDFVSVHDIVQANIMAMEQNSANYEVFNVGTGRPTAVRDVAELITHFHQKKIALKIVEKFRPGDVRHCFADISKIKHRLGFEPKVSLADGMSELQTWSSHEVAQDKTSIALRELQEKRLLN